MVVKMAAMPFLRKKGLRKEKAHEKFKNICY